VKESGEKEIIKKDKIYKRFKQEIREISRIYSLGSLPFWV
jgi:hypothetical protein